MNRTPRTAAFKKRVALEALKEERTIEEIAKEHGLNRVQVSQWKRELMEGAELIFEGTRRTKAERLQFDEEKAALERKVGQLTIEIDWLKKKLAK